MNITYVHWRYLCVGFLGIVLSVVTFLVASRPTRVASRLGMRGLKRQRALLHSAAWAELEPLVRWFGVRVSGWMSARWRKKLDAKLTYAGDFLGITPEEFVALIGLGACAGGTAGFAVSFWFADRVGLWPILLGLLVGAVWPGVRVDQERELRMKSINRGLPYAIDLLALTMSAGMDFPGSLLKVVEKSRSPNDYLIDELRFLLQQLEVGRTRRDALLTFQDRTPSEAVRELVQALVQAEAHGNPVAAVLQIQAGVARTKRTHMAQQAAQNMNSKMVLPIFMMVGVTMVLILLPTQKMMEQMMETLT